jgi:hypothetical protein
MMPKCTQCGEQMDRQGGVCDACIIFVLEDVDNFLTRRRTALPISILKQEVRHLLEVIKSSK